MGKYVDYYMNNNGEKLYKIVNAIIQKNFGWIPQKDYDDFYSIAGQVVWNCEQHYNKNSSKFSTYLTSCLLRKFKSRITYSNRDKRKLKDVNGNPIPDISINAIADEENGTKIEEILVVYMDDFNDTVPIRERFGADVQQYISRLTKQQQEIALLIAQGYTPIEIQDELGLSGERYQEQWNKMTSLRKTAILCKERKI